MPAGYALKTMLLTRRGTMKQLPAIGKSQPNPAIPFYGSRRMTVWLNGQEHQVSRKRIQRLMLTIRSIEPTRRYRIRPMDPLFALTEDDYRGTHSPDSTRNHSLSDVSCRTILWLRPTAANFSEA